ncbi:Serine/threonine-protein phosphatase [Ananas comosus]|uniref:Serine/threonine-protein phosphatase n=1 Tax=Ananas comosus TaxID=4615 RepID=A0A199VX83_ANACO|nr:Serine/threonine-protein phosphatase [Ananas comosus]
MPYTEDVLIGLAAFCLEGSAIWCSRTSLICFHIVELHLPDKVLRQFGLLQHIPKPVEAIQRITSQGRSGEDWAAFHATYIQRWADRLEHIVEKSPFVDSYPIRATSVYMQWYWWITQRWISRPVQRPPLTFLPRGNVERRLGTLSSSYLLTFFTISLLAFQ